MEREIIQPAMREQAFAVGQHEVRIDGGRIGEVNPILSARLVPGDRPGVAAVDDDLGLVVPFDADRRLVGAAFGENKVAGIVSPGLQHDGLPWPDLSECVTQVAGIGSCEGGSLAIRAHEIGLARRNDLGLCARGDRAFQLDAVNRLGRRILQRDAHMIGGIGFAPEAAAGQSVELIVHA